MLPKVGVAVIVDVGDEKDIHPPQKEPVGALTGRRAGAGLRREDRLQRPDPEGREVRHRGRDHHLRPRRGRARGQGGDLVGFTIAGKDGKFHPAKAEIKDDAVVVFSQQVPNPARCDTAGSTSPGRPSISSTRKACRPARSERTISIIENQPKK